jgi:hypothetical protein
MPLVKCRDCGYLASRIKADNSPVEAVSRVRDAGQFSLQESREVLCYRGFSGFPVNGTLTDRPLAVALEKEIACPEFTVWLKGKTPKEHEDMSILEKVRQEYRQSQEDAERKADQKADARERKEDSRHWRTFWLAVAALVASIAIGIANFAFTLSRR